jgi:hypothetical protein
MLHFSNEQTLTVSMLYLEAAHEAIQKRGEEEQHGTLLHAGMPMTYGDLLLP